MKCKLLIEQFEKLNENTYTGRIIKGDKGWSLTIDSIKFSKVYTDEEIKKVLNLTLDQSSKTDFADDGAKYTFDANKFDKYLDGL